MNAPSGPKAVVFDVGGVLSGDPFAALDEYGDRFGLARGALRRYLIDDEEFGLVETGHASIADYLLALPGRILADHGLTISPSDVIAGSLRATRCGPR